MSNFNIELLPQARKFILGMNTSAQEKVLEDLRKARDSNDVSVFKKLNRNIWEFRSRWNGIEYRFLAFWSIDTNSLVIATHGFIKKTQKTPLQEIRKAEQIRKIYLEIS
ncbi:type II toxin-antitoxin system RelE/ParE family toxin [Myroides sp. N17-2]|uniref:type II toxin-antitoxin system RelE/ParE family toxin n=1 Tax=Myroides sp. N17-2 TaxID=2030799 RepID=UPI000EFB33A6|nr:type II toxin-antitoxin system RelE/ParE family toxin [Myroides sp. N17-2]